MAGTRFILVPVLRTGTSIFFITHVTTINKSVYEIFSKE